MNTLQFAVAIPLLFVLFFGISFIINMLLKTTWVPGLVFLTCVVLALKGKENILSLVNASFFIAGLAGCVTGIWTIRTLRSQGYRMF
ncbi:YuiB family protein [Pasteuria penetrans]|uniref:YuiB family protein n=1 Tax=Pasteuria penetrans TaxID=86005 RepID=UPI000FC00BCF|nr:YuiB family protein [Pasteuria penetrans]